MLGEQESATVNATASCGRWDFAELSAHAVQPHVHEWSASSLCCERRLPQFKQAPEVDAVLHKRSVRLLVVLAADSRNATRALTLSNIAAFSQLNEVLVRFVAVTGRCHRWEDVRAAAALLGIPFECVPRPPDKSEDVKKAGAAAFRPKLPLQILGAQRHMLHLRARSVSEDGTRPSPTFDGIWLPDADVAFSADELSAFLVRWACAFEGGAPLIAQPAMHGDSSRTSRSQQFWHLNYGREWQPSGRLAAVRAHAMHTAYVEQQAPILDGAFFAWFVREVGEPLAALQTMHGTDVGTDQLWCRAAGRFSEQQQQQQQQRAGGGRAAARVSCAVIPIPFRHRGFQKRRPPEFWKGVGSLREAAEKRWPHFWLGHALLTRHKLSSAHVEPSKSLSADVCMVRRTTSTRLGPACG